MFTTVYHALGPVFFPMLLLWTGTAYYGAEIVLKVISGETDDLAAKALILKRVAGFAMIAGIFGQVWSVATSLGALGGGIDGINGLIALISVSMWSTLAGVSVALLAEGLVMLILVIYKKPEAKTNEVAVCRN